MKLDNNIHIWSINIDEKSYKLAYSYINLLSTEEKERFYSYKFIKDKRIFIISHIALKFIISKYIGIPEKIISLEYNKFKKPYIVNKLNHPLFFNLSHSEEKTMIALSDSEVGIDIEYASDLVAIDELSNIIFSNEELASFRNILSKKEKIQYFYIIWTKKEAYLKALSIGLIDNINKINVGSKPKSELHPLKQLNNNKYILQTIDTGWKGYYAAIAYLQEKNIQKDIKLFYYDFV